MNASRNASLPLPGESRGIDAGVRIQRILECAGHHHARVPREDVFGPVAVMNVEVDDGGALDPVLCHRVRDSDGNVVEKAEAHRSFTHGVMPRRPHCAKCSAAFAARDQFGGEHDRTRGVLRGVERMSVERGVGIDIVNPRLRARRFDLVDITRGMYALELRAGCPHGRMVDEKRVETVADKPIADRVQARGTLRMERSHVMHATRRVGDECGRHGEKWQRPARAMRDTTRRPGSRTEFSAPRAVMTRR